MSKSRYLKAGTTALGILVLASGVANHAYVARNTNYSSSVSLISDAQASGVAACNFASSAFGTACTNAGGYVYVDAVPTPGGGPLSWTYNETCTTNGLAPVAGNIINPPAPIDPVVNPVVQGVLAGLQASCFSKDANLNVNGKPIAGNSTPKGGYPPKPKPTPTPAPAIMP